MAEAGKQSGVINQLDNGYNCAWYNGWVSRFAIARLFVDYRPFCRHVRILIKMT